MSDETRRAGIDAAIDAVARRMTSGDPGAGFRARVVGGIESATSGGLARHGLGLATSGALVALCAAFLVWRLGGPADWQRPDTAGRTPAPVEAAPEVPGVPRPSTLSAAAPADLQAVMSGGAATPPVAMHARRARRTRVPVATGELAARMAAEPGALQLGALNVPTAPPMPRVTLEAVAVEEIALDPLAVEAIDARQAADDERGHGR